MAKTTPTTPTPPPLSKPEMAQRIANLTGLGVGYISERLTDAEAWDVAAILLADGDGPEIAAFINPANKAT
jgi:hypothetical protein